MVDDLIQNDAALNEWLNRAYEYICRTSGLPVLLRETTYNTAASLAYKNNWGVPIAYRASDIGLPGLKSVYRVWFRDGSGKWRELKPGVMLEPKYDEVFDTSTSPQRRVFPSPLSEIRLTFPNLKMMPSDTGAVGAPSMFLYTGETLLFDKHPASGDYSIRVVGSFIPFKGSVTIVDPLSSDADRTLLPDYLDDALVSYAGARILLGYPDMYEVMQIWKSHAYELIQFARAELVSNIVSYSPGSALETLGGVSVGNEPSASSSGRGRKRG